MQDRLNAVEATLAAEETRYRQREARSTTHRITFTGALDESVEDFFADVDRFMANHGLQQQQAGQYLPDLLTGTASEFFRTLAPPTTDNLENLRAAFVAQFASATRRQIALQAFYQADQKAGETASQYYCRLKSVARAAYQGQTADVRGQQVAARMRQELRPEIKRLMIGQQFANTEDLRSAAEAIEVELQTLGPANPVTKTDLQELVSAVQEVRINQDACKKPPTAAVITNASPEEPPTLAFVRRQQQRQKPETYQREERECYYCGRQGHLIRECRTKEYEEQTA